MIIRGNCREEEKMHTIRALTQEVKASPSYPHVTITFERIERGCLLFSILLVRKKGVSIEKMFDSDFIFFPERSQTYDGIEVHSFFLKMENGEFLRKDGSIRLPSARRRIAKVLEKGLGRMRDYNGGFIEKKEENLRALIKMFPGAEEEFVEDFFYSIRPAKAQGLLLEKTLFHFFHRFQLHLFNKCPHRFYESAHGNFAYFRSRDPDIDLRVRRTLYQKEIDLHSVISAHLMRRGMQHSCFFWKGDDLKKGPEGIRTFLKCDY